MCVPISHHSKLFMELWTKLFLLTRQSNLPRPSKLLETKWTSFPFQVLITICARKNCYHGQTHHGKRWDGRHSRFSNVTCPSNSLPTGHSLTRVACRNCYQIRQQPLSRLHTPRTRPNDRHLRERIGLERNSIHHTIDAGQRIAERK